MLNSKQSNTSIVKNTSWGVLSNVLQILFVTGFFIIIARKYSSDIFAQFLIASTVYQIVAAFSSLGLGQWFIREYSRDEDKRSLTSNFLKMQALLGIGFYFFNIALAYLLYDDGLIRILGIVLGTNILFDNLINAIKTLNIAEGQQKKTAIILSADGLLKLLAASLLFIYPLSAVMLAAIMIAARVLTLGLFIRMGSSGTISMKALISSSISLNEIKLQVTRNWQFIIIGSISIIYWRFGNIIISKMLSLQDVADYEIAFRILSVMLIIPVVASATIYPRFIALFKDHDLPGLKRFYHSVFRIYALFSVLTYAFIYCFAELLIPTLFGPSYPDAILTVKQMFLTYLLFPTVLLQANLLVAMGMEKLDMWFNVLSLLVNVGGCIIGLYFIKELAVINYSVLLSFTLFHLLQDAALIRKKITTLTHCAGFYGLLILTVFGLAYLNIHVNPFLTFAFLLAGALLFLLLWARNNRILSFDQGIRFKGGHLQ